MSEVHRLSREEARQIAVRAQLLDADRPTDLLDVVRRLTFVQYDLTAAVAPSADLVLWSRLGPSYEPAQLRDAVDQQQLIDHHSLLRPSEDMALFRAEMAQWPGTGELRPWQVEQIEWVRANDSCRRDILELLRADGPLPTSALPDTCQVRWPSSGWNNNKNVPMLLMLMVERGEVAAAGRDGRDKLWDLAERIYPDDPESPVPDAEEGRRLRDLRRLSALGIARARSAKMPGEPNHVGDAGEPAEVEGVKGAWRVDPGQVARLGEAFEGRVALLSPLDRLVYDRKRAMEIFEYEYQLEMYKPATSRRWGYFALPILYGDRLIGKLDASADRAEGVLVVHAVHEDAPFSDDVAAAVLGEIEALARWLHLDLQLPER